MVGSRQKDSKENLNLRLAILNNNYQHNCDPLGRPMQNYGISYSSAKAPQQQARKGESQEIVHFFQNCSS